jgi:hypothetical protein
VGFARVKNKKSIWRAKPQSRQGLRKSNQSDYNFFASLRLCEKKKISLPAMLQSSPLNSTRKRWELMAIFEINWNREKAMNVDFLYLKIEAYLRNEA